MKKYNIILTELSEQSVESKQIIYESFAKEFAISVSGASIMLKHLPTLLEIDVDQKRAQKYVDFFNKYGGSVELKERKRDTETLPPIPLDNSEPELETVAEEELEDIQTNDEKETVLEDDSMPVLEDLQINPSEPKEYIEKSDKEKNIQYEPDNTDLALNKVKAEFMQTISNDDSLDNLDDNQSFSDYSTYIVDDEDLEMDVDDSEYVGVFQCPSCGFTVETSQETCPICNTPMVQEKPKAKPKKDETLQPDYKLGHKTTKKATPFTVVTPPPPPYPSWKKELSTITTETLIASSLASYVLLIMFIFSKVDMNTQLINSVIPFGVGVFLFITGRIYTYFEEKFQKKGIPSTFAGVLRSLFAFPGGKVASANHELYQLKPEVFGRKYFFVINGFLFLLTLSFITAPTILHSYDAYFAKTSDKEIAGKKHKPTKKVAAKKVHLDPKTVEKIPKETEQTNKDKDTTKEIKETKTKESDKIVISSIPKKSLNNKKRKIQKDKGVVGKKVRITLKNNFQLIGWIISEAEDNYTLEGFQYGGRFSFSILKEDIEKIAIVPKNEENERS